MNRDIAGDAGFAGRAEDLSQKHEMNMEMSNNMQMPQSRYVLPSFVEHSSFGAKESNPYNKLFEERIIFLGSDQILTTAPRFLAVMLGTSK